MLQPYCFSRGIPQAFLALRRAKLFWLVSIKRALFDKKESSFVSGDHAQARSETHNFFSKGCSAIYP